MDDSTDGVVGVADNRRPTYLEPDGEGGWRRIWRASGLGACDRSLVMHALEMPAAPTPAHIQAAYDAGSANEAEIIRRACQQEGWKPLTAHDRPGLDWDGTGQLRVELRCGRVGGVEQIIRCHPDAIVRRWKATAQDGVIDGDVLGTERVLEAKHLRRGSPYTTVAKARSSRFYAWQTSVEMHGTGLGLMMAVGWKERVEDEGADGGVRETVGDVDVEMFDTPMYKLGQVKARVLGLARMVQRAEEEGLGVVACDWKMYPCPFYDTHDGQDVWKEREEGDGLELGADDAIRLTALAGEVEKARMMRERYEQKRKDAAERLRQALAECAGQRGNTYKVGDFTIEWRYTPARDEEERVVKYKAKAESESIVVKQGKGGGA